MEAGRQRGTEAMRQGCSEAGTKEAGGTASPAPVQAPEAQPAHRSKQQALDACREQHGKLIRCLTSASWSSFNGAWYCPSDRA